MKIYLAGPMTGIENFNYPAFNHAAARLRSWGYVVKNPAETDNGSSNRSREYYLREAIKLLLECNTIALLPGWEKSQGAKLELEIAKELGMLIIDAQTLAPVFL